MSIGEAINKLGWRQGYFVKADDHDTFSRLFGIHVDNNHRIIILSQSCDLTHNHLENEPRFDLILAEHVSKSDGRLKNAKNGRKLQIEAIDSGEVKLFHLSAANWHKCDRQHLVELSPDSNIKLNADSEKILLNWLANRYKRTAFPDSFINNLIPSIKNIEKIVESFSDEITTLMVSLSSWGELDDYEVKIIGLAKPSAFSNEEQKKELNALIEKLAIELNKCTGINVEDYEVISESRATISLVREMRIWDWSYLSLANEDVETLPMGTL